MAEPDRQAKLRAGWVWLGGGLAVNYAWEMTQMPLYAGLGDGWRTCFVAALGDVAILGLLYVLMACAAERWLWFQSLSLSRTVLLASLGFLVAAVVELQALSEGRWSYAAGMPRIPILRVGLVPVLQMILIPLGLAWLSRIWRVTPWSRGDLQEDETRMA